MTNTAPADSGTTLAGKLPDRNGFYGTDYSCNFGFQQKYTDADNFPDGVTNPFRDAATTDNTPMYIVAGSNERDPIQVNIPTDSFSGNLPDNFDFKEKAEATANPNGDNIFQHFPTGVGSRTTPTINPYRVCIQQDLCPEP